MSIIKKKSPKNFAGWLKIYPDAIKVTGSAKEFLPEKELLILAGIKEGGQVLMDNTYCLSTKNGIVCTLNAVVTPCSEKKH